MAPETRNIKATVIINNYNYGRFLATAIESALNQTYADTEVVVVDDGSTDDSRQIIAGYGNRIRPVLKANGGQASTFNAGFAASTGDVICMLDSDDLFYPNKVERIAEPSIASGDRWSSIRYAVCTRMAEKRPRPSCSEPYTRMSESLHSAASCPDHRVQSHPVSRCRGRCSTAFYPCRSRFGSRRTTISFSWLVPSSEASISTRFSPFNPYMAATTIRCGATGR
jgi:glycosyltransferase involved in cell wall biosynthesis